MSKLLTPQEVLQALLDGKQILWKYKHAEKWNLLDDYDITFKDILCDKVEFSLVPEMITIGDVSFPKPENEKPELTTEYYMPCLNSEAFYTRYFWEDCEVDQRFLRIGILHLTRENAVAHAKALIKLSGGNVDD